MKIKVLSKSMPQLGSGLQRSEGLHVSNIISDMAVELGMFEKRDDKKETDVRDCKFEMGFNWEETLGDAWAGRTSVYRPEEIVLDGIACSPDGIGCDDDGIYVAEYKHTWYSVNKNFSEQWYWLTQGKSYCKVVDCLRCIWEIAYVCGDYKYPINPQYRKVAVTFDEDEIEENWISLINHAKAKGWL